MGDTGTIHIAPTAGSITGSRVIRLGYTEATIAQVKTLPAGKRVAVQGKVSSPLQVFRDSSAFVFDSSGSLRIRGARGPAGSAGNGLGDSVVVVGTTGSAQGQPVLNDGFFRTFGPGLAPLPTLLSVADARTAQGGKLDGAFVQVSNVTIVDTLPSTPDFILDVADATAPSVTIVVLLDQLLNAPHGLFVPGKTATLRGVLIPRGDGTWLLKPRGALDIILN